MSNYLAVATVTETLAQIIREAVLPRIHGAEVTTDRPDRAGKDAAARVNVYLFQTAPNAALRNADLPVRYADGTQAGRPRAALDLFYLVTFYGKDEQLVAQQLMGLTVASLHANALITPEQIRRAIRAAPGDFLAGSDLALAPQPVTVAPLTLSLEELSKLWSIMFQVPYSLTVAYQCSVVMLDAGAPAPAPLPVRSVGADVNPGAAPAIQSVAAGDGGPPTYGAPLVITGRGFGGSGATVLLDGVALPTPGSDASDSKLTVTLQGRGIVAGFGAVQVRRDDGVMSGAMPLSVHPAVSAAQLLDASTQDDGTRGGTVRVSLLPEVSSDQRVTLFLNGMPGSGGARPPSYAFDRPPGATDPAGTVQVPVRGVAPGTYLVRVAVDGAQSGLQSGPDGAGGTRWTGPTLTVSS